jgi:hypothetical protein
MSVPTELLPATSAEEFALVQPIAKGAIVGDGVWDQRTLTTLSNGEAALARLSTLI